ncbi:zinc transport system ATP-binding protein [Shimia gijangensis]|uniref:Zinc transport system ATP-binding protein n=1 Tax=Shimia gijangensis TaxID=1470563 RepID=A0A1M6NSM9_9RHOB|nr:metal ABC transporter ATP-binding protein [Shimia gijangensis]SHJ98648.1 zinc transport system ATP-binding protein [Shimia gijangensis]
MSLVTLMGLGVRLGRHQALSHVDFSIDKGEIVTVVGPNGSGKTTLLRSIIGAQKPTSGKIVRAKGLRIGYVPQSLSIDATLPLTVNRFLNLPLRHDREVTEQALSVAGAQGLQERQMSALSGGQFQRILLARALLKNPDLLILDEPTTGLDQPGSAALYRQIEQVRSDLGTAILMVSHELHVVMSASDRVVCLNGHVCCHGTPEIVASAPEYRALFGSGTQGALALYRHDHDHHHHSHDSHSHEHGTCDHA